MDITALSEDQQSAYADFASFILDTNEYVFVLEGHSGTGKTTLVKHMVDNLPSLLKTRKLLLPESTSLGVEVTATTNKAAEVLSDILGSPVRTVYSFIGLRVQKDFQTRRTYLARNKGKDNIYNTIIFVDEASFINGELLSLLFSSIDKSCKIVFVGDPSQILAVNASEAVVFKKGFKGSKLTNVVRQCEDSPIIQLSSQFREAVQGKGFFSFIPDGTSVKHLNRADFVEEIRKEFIDPSWNPNRAKVITWTNDLAIKYNQAISADLTGSLTIKEGDYVICNRFMVSSGSNTSIKSDQQVRVNGVGPDIVSEGVLGNEYSLDHFGVYFMPKDPSMITKRMQAATMNKEYDLAAFIDTTWIDLRAAYACTADKSQGSTYDKVFIDLDDFKKCRDPIMMARRLYVAVSRARIQVVLTGDII